jgi:hypothetical protein
MASPVVRYPFAVEREREATRRGGSTAGSPGVDQDRDPLGSLRFRIASL